MSEGVIVALITGLLSLAGVVVTVASKRTQAGALRRLERELGEAKKSVAEARGEAEKYRSAYLGLLEVTQELLVAGQPVRPR